MSTTRNFAAAIAVLILSTDALGQGAEPAVQMAAQQPIIAGDLTIIQAWSRATPPAAATGAGYLTITNIGAVDDRLLGITSSAAELAALHQMIMNDERMMMQPLEDGLIIAAGATIVLDPGGFHVMFFGIGDGFIERTLISASLTFAIAGTVEISLIVYPIGSPGPTNSP